MIRATFTTRPRRLLCWDVENRPIAYWVPDRPTSQITAIGWKWSHEDHVQSVVLLSNGRWQHSDGRRYAARRTLEMFRAELVRADVSYGHNVRSHDLPLFQSALLRGGLDPLPPLRTTDTFRDYPRRKDMSVSLENLAKLYGLGAEKKHMSVVDWELANQLESAGIAEARDRVESDVLLQERLRARLEELGLLKEPRVWRP